MEKIFGRDIPAFNAHFMNQVTCTNSACGFNQPKQMKIYGPYLVTNIEDYKNIGKGILGNRFFKSCINYIEDENCTCHDSMNSIPKKILEEKVMILPKYLILNIESIFNENNCLDSNIGHRTELEID